MDIIFIIVIFIIINDYLMIANNKDLRISCWGLCTNNNFHVVKLLWY